MSPSDAEFAALLERHLPALRLFVAMRMGRELRAREESCDIVQSVAREVLQHAERFAHGGEAGFRDWLFTTAHRKVANRVEHWRAEKRDQRREEPDRDLGEAAGAVGTPSRLASLREELVLVEAAFGQLSDEQRDVVAMSRLAGWSHREIAERLGKSEVAVRKTLSRALARLACALADGDG